MTNERWVKFSRDELLELMAPGVGVFALSKATLRGSVHDKLLSALERNDDHRLLGDRFKDDRGEIRDLIDGPVDSVTWIRTLEGGVRGNHYHERTTQWTYVLSGRLLICNPSEWANISPRTRTLEAGEITVDKPGVPHAWKALEDTDCIVFTLGPRSGVEYESDTIRLDVPLLT